MRNKKRHLLKAIMMTLAMLAALVGLVYAMQYTQGPQFRAALELFLNPQAQKSWAWCPEGTELIEWSNSEIKTPAPAPNQVCIVQTESSTLSAEDLKDLAPLLVAKAGEKTRTLESDPSFGLFRIDGLPFKSKSLSQFFKRLMATTEVQDSTQN